MAGLLPARRREGTPSFSGTAHTQGALAGEVAKWLLGPAPFIEVEVPRISGRNSSILCLLLLSCGTQRYTPQLAVPAGRHGLVHGGQQPVAGATIQLYAVGTTGDGSASTPLLSPAPATDANGTFNISGTYTCPSPSSLVYIVASGGNPGLAPGTNNAALSLMAALGPCGNLSPSTFILINEVTTVAAVYALAPYMTSPSAIGSSAGDAAALAAAFTLAAQFANTTTGATPGTGVPAGTIVPAEQINTIGNIIAACINSPGGTSGDTTPCGMLFSLTTLPGLTPATNTATALLHLADNPTLNTASLYNLVTPTAPFQPSQPQVPADLSVRLTVPSGFTASTMELDFPLLAWFTVQLQARQRRPSRLPTTPQHPSASISRPLAMGVRQFQEPTPWTSSTRATCRPARPLSCREQPALCSSYLLLWQSAPGAHT